MFYLLKNKKGDPLDEPVLYAITDDKSKAKDFIGSRNGSLFYERKITCEKAEALAMMNGARKHIITYSEFKTKDKMRISKVTVCCTWGEESEVILNPTNIYKGCTKHLWLPISIFSKKNFNALRDVQFFSKMDIGLTPDYYGADMNNLTFDELGLFVKCYGWTLKNER